MIEKVTGQPWHRAMRQQFFDPLQLAHTRYGDNDALIANRAAGYTTNARREVVSVTPLDPAVPDAAGALVSTAHDQYGLGVYVWHVRGETMVGHTGQIPGFASVVPAAATLDALVGTYGTEPGPERTLSIKDGRLHAQRGSGNAIPLQMTAEGRLHFDPDGLTYFVQVRDPSGAVVRLDYDADGDPPAVALPRVVPPVSQSR